MASPQSEFAHYCCEILASVGPCIAKRMFGGWGISTDGLTIAIIADLGSGEKLWLKGNDDNRTQWETAGCERFTYTTTKNCASVSRGMNYFSAPEEAMDSTPAMAAWARLALQAALSAKTPAKAPANRSAKTTKPTQPRRTPTPKPAKPTRLGKPPAKT